jgi:hypothetical protein
MVTGDEAEDHLMAGYAEDTKVSVDRTLDEIRRTLIRYDADGYIHGYDGTRGVVAFTMGGRQIRMFVVDPDPASREVTRTERGGRRPEGQRPARIEQLRRQRWRILLLTLKAKLEAVRSGAVTLDEEFLAHIVLPSGATVGQWVGPQLAEVYESGDMPALLPGVSGELPARTS